MFSFILIVFAASERGSGMQWSFSNKVSALPPFISFKTPQENRPRKTVDDPLGPSTLMTISTVDAFDTSQKPFSSAIQVSLPSFLYHVLKLLYGYTSPKDCVIA